MMTRQFVGSSGKWSDRVVCVVSMQPAKWGKQHEQQVQRITTFRLEQSCREVNNMIPPGSCKSLPQGRAAFPEKAAAKSCILLFPLQ